MNKEDLNELKKILDTRWVLTVATSDNNIPWICNMYFAYDKDLNFYCVSSKASKHGIHFSKNPNVALTVAIYDPNNLSDRKGAQIIASVSELSEIKDINEAIEIYKSRFESAKDWLSVEMVSDEKGVERIFKFKPSYLKLWSDELFGKDKLKEYNLP